MYNLPLAIAALLLASGVLQTAVPSTTSRENLAAFARLYGVARYFYPGDAVASLDWDRFASYGVNQVINAPAGGLVAVLERLFVPLGPGFAIGRSLPPPPKPANEGTVTVAWRYVGPAIAPAKVYTPYTARRTNRPAQANAAPESPGVSAYYADFEVSAGLLARVPLVLTDAEARTELPAFDKLRTMVASSEDPTGRSDLDVRLADVVVAWSAYRHFFPYESESAVAWDDLLLRSLDAARTANTRVEHRTILRQFVAEMRDGHGFVADPFSEPSVALPIQLRIVEGKVAVTESALDAVPVASVITDIDGVPVDQRLRAEMSLVSGSEQWKRWLAPQGLERCQRGTTVRLSFLLRETAKNAELPCVGGLPGTSDRPGPIGELEPGIWYIDLTRAKWLSVQATLSRLASAAALVFDVRGYPTDAGVRLLPHLIEAPENDRWMHIPNIVGPFGRIGGWRSLGWDLKPATPRLAKRRMFLTDSRAISYAESVMGYVSDRHLGTIVGGETAGANGNVVNFNVPGGLVLGFTGMRVTGHDGRRQRHLIGVQPDVAIEPTLAGLRDRRDEVLDRALALARARP